MLHKETPLRARAAGSAFFILGAAVAANLFFFQEKRRVSPVVTAALTSKLTQDGLPSHDYARDTPIVLRPGAANATQAPPEVQSIARTNSEPAMSRAEIVRGIQRELNTRGYSPGSPDGVAGLVTRAAIMAYEHDNGISLTGDPTQELLGRIVLGPAVPAVARPGKSDVKGAEAAAVVKSVAQLLAAQGYGVAKSEGGIDAALVKSIRDFEAGQKLPETGRISAPLVSRLIRLQGQTRAAAQR
jgi:peptidoglycan hydrolase-like protein with peptidoglycan-binding domain